jgi:hypothetical protein
MKTSMKDLALRLGLGCLLWLGAARLGADEAPAAPATTPTPVVVDGAAAAEEMGADAVQTKKTVRRKSGSNDDSIKEYIGMGMGVLALLAGSGIAYLAIWSDYRKRRDLIDMLHRERMLALEKGLELPEIPRNLVGEPADPKPSGPVSSTRGLKSGLVWLVIGIGFTLFFFFEGARGGDGRWHGPNPAIGLIPAGIGIVNLICFWVERRARKASA